jgi:hypothetical protein
MTSGRAKAGPSLEVLEDRLALSGMQPVLAATAAQVQNTLAVLTAFTRAYQSHPGNPNYNPALDLNHNNQIAQVDGKLLLSQLPALSPNVPLTLTVAIAPQDRFTGPHPTNSGGVTFNKKPTVIGHTTPGALIFTGTGTLDLKLRGPAYVADAQGNFSIPVTLSDGINQFDLQAVDAYGHQTLRAFPILWLGFAKYEAEHPTNK